MRPPSTTVPLPEGILRFGVAMIATRGYMLTPDPRIEWYDQSMPPSTATLTDSASNSVMVSPIDVSGQHIHLNWCFYFKKRVPHQTLT